MARWAAGAVRVVVLGHRVAAKANAANAQTRREIDEGMWHILPETTPFPWPLGTLPLMLEIKHVGLSRGRMHDGVVKML